MDFNLLFSVVLYAIIGLLLLMSFKIFVKTRWELKTFQNSYLQLQEKLVLEQSKQEQTLQKNTYLENYNITLFHKLFEITRELLLTKKIIFEEHYN